MRERGQNGTGKPLVKQGRHRKGGRTTELNLVVTLQQACDAFAESNSHPTIKLYHSRLLNKYVMPAVGDSVVGDLTDSDLRVLVSKMATRGASEEVIHRTLTALAAVLSYAERRGLIALGKSNTCRLIARQHRQPLQIPRVNVPTYADLRRIVDSAADMWPALIRTAALAGLRSNELRTLTWDVVDLDGCSLWMSRKSGELTHNRYIKMRCVPLPPGLVQVLKERKAAISRPSGCNLVFPGPSGGMISPNALRIGFARVQKAAGIGMENVGAHVDSATCRYSLLSLRHFFSIWCIDEVGLSWKQTCRLLGRSDLPFAMWPPGHDCERWGSEPLGSGRARCFPR